jgi:leucyl aminopeptidase
VSPVPIEISLPGQTRADALAVPVSQPLSGDGARVVDDKLGGRLAALIASGELRGSRGDAVVLHVDGELETPRVVAVGLGKRDALDLDAFRTAGAAAAHALERVGGTHCWLLDESLDVPLADQAAGLVEGTILGGYSPGGWKTQHTETRPRAIERIVVGHFDTQELRDAAESAALVAALVNQARDLSNTPPNELSPHTLGERAKELAREHDHLTCEVLGTRELDDLGMGALSAVGRGSRNEPRLIVLRYEPPEAREATSCSASSARRSRSTPAGSRSSRARRWRT